MYIGNSLAVQWLGHSIFTDRAWVQSLVRELRSCKLHTWPKINNKIKYLSLINPSKLSKLCQIFDTFLCFYPDSLCADTIYFNANKIQFPQTSYTIHNDVFLFTILFHNLVHIFSLPCKQKYTPLPYIHEHA